MDLESPSAHVAFKRGAQSRGNSNGRLQGGGGHNNGQFQQGNRGNYNNRGNGRGRGRGGRGHFRPVCQICGKTGHLASTCYFRFDHNFTASHNTQSTSQNSNATAFIASPETVNDPSWYVDSGATNHIIADLNNLHVKDDYKGKGKIVVGNGHSLLISHIGSSQISSCAKPLLLNNILYAPAITKNLLSVSHITRDNHSC